MEPEIEKVIEEVEKIEIDEVEIEKVEPEIKEESHPVGVAVQDEAIDNFILVMLSLWDNEKEAAPPWYKPWQRISFTKVTNFLMTSLDDLIAYVDDYVDANGADKKATVIAAVGRLYDHAVVEAMPVFLKPFSTAIKNYIINDLVGASIDWIVGKYRDGQWRKKDAVQLKVQWAIQAQSIGTPFGNNLPK